MLMKSELLRRARDYEAENLPRVLPSMLPCFHVTGGVGWINDPNGFSMYRGEYHLFFQYYPYDTHWNYMHWGHVKSGDLIRWERLPCALAPDEAYDKDGCFSGSALELRDGRHLLMYTGVSKTDEGEEFQTQCIAFGDGKDYVKYEANPVIDASLLPKGGSARDFRDPKIWQEDGKFFAVTGNLRSDGYGAVLLFESEDALCWKFVSELASSGGRHGRMWECPDLFSLDGRKVLIVSPQEMRSEGLEFIEGNAALYMIGELAPDGSLRCETTRAMDYGLDFYAPQTLLTSDGRRVMIAWMQYWNSVDVHPREDLPFFGQMTLPRELNIRGGRLVQNPVRELNAYRGDPVICTSVPVSGRRTFPGICGRCLDLTVRIRPAEDGRFSEAAVNIAEGEGFITTVKFHPGTNTVTVDRSCSGWPESVKSTRTFEIRDLGGCVTLRLILDRYSLELFVNDGEQAASFVIFSPQEADGISFTVEGTAVMDIEKYDLRI